MMQQEHYAGIALAGPRARDVLAALIGAEPPAPMGVARGVVAGVPVLVLAASYSGERAFEICAEGHAAAPVWQALEAAVRAAGGCPYGLEAIEFLRIEKGHVLVGGEADGRTTPHDLGLEKMLNKAGGFIGASALTRPALNAADRLQLVGLASLAGPIAEGAMLCAAQGRAVEGHVTAAARRLIGAMSGAISSAAAPSSASLVVAPAREIPAPSPFARREAAAPVEAPAQPRNVKTVGAR